MNALGGLSKPQAIIIGVVFLIVVFIVLGATGIIPLFTKDTADPNMPKTAQLTVWGLSEDQAGFQDIITAYKNSSETVKNYQISFVGFKDGQELEQRLVNSLAEGSGPDLFFFHNSWNVKHAAKTQAAYAQLVTPQFVAGSFPQAVYDDFVLKTADNSYVLALPLHMDSLALLYNKDIMDAAGITYEQKTWDALSWNDILSIVQRVRKIEGSTITRAGIALGTTRNIEHAADIISSLLMQSGLPAYQTDGRVSLGSAAQNPYNFYMQFSTPSGANYTWNDAMGDSEDEFAQGRVAMIVDYLSAMPRIREKNKFLNMAAVPLPQLSSDANVKRSQASYWGLAVSRFSTQAYAAWHFAKFAVTNESSLNSYLQKTGKFPALKSLINKQADGDMGAVLKGFLFARSWKKADPDAANAALLQVIQDVRVNRIPMTQAILSAERKINQ